jgi:hypothetical protein
MCILENTTYPRRRGKIGRYSLGENCDKGMGNRENVTEKLRKIKYKGKYKNECKRGEQNGSMEN